jgi:hypothetical protein
LCRYFVYFCFVKEFSNSNPGRKRVVEFLNQPIYSGHIEVEKWDISLRKGRHEALITLETYYAIPERLHGKPRVPTRKNINADFPLRGFVTCGHCNQPLTANWLKGRQILYPCYLCHTKGCTSANCGRPLKSYAEIALPFKALEGFSG